MKKQTKKPMPVLADKDACELLDADHLAVKHLLVEYARLAVLGGAAPERQALARRICEDLTVHAQIEEEIFYPALQEAIAAPGLVEAALAEHQQAKELIAQIEALSQADAQMDDLVAQLACAIEQHVKEERTQLFPKAQASSLDLDALGAQLKERQQELQGQPA